MARCSVWELSFFFVFWVGLCGRSLLFIWFVSCLVCFLFGWLVSRPVLLLFILLRLFIVFLLVFVGFVSFGFPSKRPGAPM